MLGLTGKDKSTASWQLHCKPACRAGWLFARRKGMYFSMSVQFLLHVTTPIFVCLSIWIITRVSISVAQRSIPMAVAGINLMRSSRVYAVGLACAGVCNIVLTPCAL